MDRSAVSPPAPFTHDLRNVSVAERRALVNVQVIVTPADSVDGMVNEPFVTVTPLSQASVVAYLAGSPVVNVSASATVSPASAVRVASVVVDGAVLVPVADVPPLVICRSTASPGVAFSQAL